MIRNLKKKIVDIDDKTLSVRLKGGKSKTFQYFWHKLEINSRHIEKGGREWREKEAEIKKVGNATRRQAKDQEFLNWKE